MLRRMLIEGTDLVISGVRRLGVQRAVLGSMLWSRAPTWHNIACSHGKCSSEHPAGPQAIVRPSGVGLSISQFIQPLNQLLLSP